MPIDSEPPDLLPMLSETVVAGALATHAVESPGHGTPVHTHCENCGATLSGPFCHRCGQHDIEFHRSFGHVFLEALENFFHFDAKLFRNIVTLLFRPGRLTAEFNRGKRASQMPPFRLYLFISVLFFFVSFLGRDHEIDDFKIRRPGDGPVSGDDAREQAEAMRAALAAVKTEIARKTKDPEKAARARAALEKIERVTALPLPAAPAVIADGTRPPGEAGAPGEKKADRIELNRDTPAFARELTERGQRIYDNPKEFMKALLHALPKMLLFCLPLFALYTRVLFRKTGLVYLQHLILALHYHSFVYLWWLFARGWRELAGLWSPGLGDFLGFLSGLWLFLYPFLMLRQLFGQSWTRIICKTLFLAGLYTLTLLLAVAAMGAAVFFLL